MDAKHTPGPWTKDLRCIKAQDGTEICQFDYTQEGYVQANARLIAAAPDLLAAAKAVMFMNTVDNRAALQAAIALADGTEANND